MLESKYQSDLVRKLEALFPGCLVIKSDSALRQGIPDLLVLYRSTWAALEVKASRSSRTRPNQQWWIDEMNEMSFASFIYPENETEVLSALQSAFQPDRPARFPKR